MFSSLTHGFGCPCNKLVCVHLTCYRTLEPVQGPLPFALQLNRLSVLLFAFFMPFLYVGLQFVPLYAPGRAYVAIITWNLSIHGLLEYLLYIVLTWYINLFCIFINIYVLRGSTTFGYFFLLLNLEA